VSLDLDAYLDRIGWRRPLAADLATVSGLLDRHIIAIPFENLDVLFGTRFRGTDSETTKLADRTALRETLVTQFGFDLDVEGIRVPQIPEWT
jgi:arylamine N-acetyltransferase